MTLIVHHLQISQSERIPWLCEELGVNYELKNYKRAPLMAPPEYKALHHSGSAPVIQDGSLTLAESGACMEYISHKYANGKLFLKPDNPSYADFLYWFHWVNGTFQPAIMRVMAVHTGGMSSDSMQAKIAFDRLKRGLTALNEQLSDKEWLAGSEFTAADVMIGFSLTTVRYFSPYSLQEYPNVLEYLKRTGKREAYQRAMKKSDPDMELLLGADPPKKSLMY